MTSYSWTSCLQEPHYVVTIPKTVAQSELRVQTNDIFQSYLCRGHRPRMTPYASKHLWDSEIYSRSRIPQEYSDEGWDFRTVISQVKEGISILPSFYNYLINVVWCFSALRLENKEKKM